jgi:hypothetical protein
VEGKVVELPLVSVWVPAVAAAVAGVQVRVRVQVLEAVEVGAVLLAAVGAHPGTWRHAARRHVWEVVVVVVCQVVRGS